MTVKDPRANQWLNWMLLPPSIYDARVLVKTGGDDEIKHVPTAGKLNINAKPWFKSTLLEKLLQNTKALIRFFLKGCMENKTKDKIRFYVLMLPHSRTIKDRGHIL